MRNSFTTLLFSLLFSTSLARVGAVTGVAIAPSGTNAVLSWPSGPGNTFLIQSKSNLAVGPWQELTNYYPANSGTNRTLFYDPMVFVAASASTNGSGGGGLPPFPPEGDTNSALGGTNMMSSASMFYRVFDVTPVAKPTYFGIEQDSADNQLPIFRDNNDPNDDYLLMAGLSGNAHGSIVYSLDATVFEYTPDSGFYGIDAFIYSMTNLHGGLSSNTARVFVNKAGNNKPSATDLLFVLPTNSFSVSFGSISNTFDVDGDTNTLVLLTAPWAGSVTSDANGVVTYTRYSSLYGDDSFRYVVTDGNGGMAEGTVVIQQQDTTGTGIPDQWCLAYALDPASDNTLGDPDADGLPNSAELILGTNPLMSDNPLNLFYVTNQTKLAGYTQIPIAGINPNVLRPPLVLKANGQLAGDASFVKGPDGIWQANWPTHYLTNGSYSLQVGLQAKPESVTNVIFGAAKTVTVTNSVVFDRLTSRFSDFLLIDARLSSTAANFTVELFDEYGDPLVYGGGSTTNGRIQLYWDLTDGQGNVISDGNIRAKVSSADSGTGVTNQPAEAWFLKEPFSVPRDGFVVAWGWDSYGTSFLNHRNDMMQNGVINILGNPADFDSYDLRPLWNVPYGGTSFRYDNDMDKTNLLAELTQNSYFFWVGHGSYNTIAGNTKKSNINPTEVQLALGNFSHQSTKKHPKTDAHPYKLVVMNGCNVYEPTWSQAFGISFSADTSTNTVSEYEFTGRVPRAFVGWTDEVLIPGGWDFNGSAHTYFALALAHLWSDWMAGYPLEFCMDHFESTALNEGFTGQDSWKISGCYNLTRWK